MLRNVQSVFSPPEDSDGSGMGRCITVPVWEKMLCFTDVYFKFPRKKLTEEFFYYYCFTWADNWGWVCKGKMTGYHQAPRNSYTEVFSEMRTVKSMSSGDKQKEGTLKYCNC